MQEMAPRFSKFSGGACPRTPLANSLASLGRSLAALGRAPRIITLPSIFETWQACVPSFDWCKYLKLRKLNDIVCYSKCYSNYCSNLGCTTMHAYICWLTEDRKMFIRLNNEGSGQGSVYVWWVGGRAFLTFFPQQCYQTQIVFFFFFFFFFFFHQ